jgi:hypothetical protein
LFHGVDVRGQFRFLRHDHRVKLNGAIVVPAKQRQHLFEQGQTFHTAVLFVFTGEVLADVAKARRPKQRVHERVGERIPVRVTVQTFIVGNFHPAQNKGNAFFQTVRINANADVKVQRNGKLLLKIR